MIRPALDACAALRRSVPTLALLVLALVAMGPSVFAAPEPEPIPRRWQLRVEAGDLRVASFETADGPRAYLYMTFKVTNASGEDRDFAPSFELATDTGQVVRSGRDVPRDVVDSLLAKIDNPFLTDETGTQGRLLQGPENAREGLVVFLASEMQASEYTVFLTGFSGETKAVARPDTGQQIILRKTLMLSHAGTGRLDPTSGTHLPRTQERWILR